MDIQRMVNEMTLEEKVGQMFMLAFAANRLDEARTLIEEKFIGGCYLSHDNAPTAQSALSLSNKLQEFAQITPHRIPLILGVDQEGTWAVLVPESTTGPGNLALGASFQPDLTERMYEIIGTEMSAVGYNAVLAPCCDVNTNPLNPIIGMRSFGEKPDLVAEHSAAAVRGLHRAGEISAAKHFPGHGDTVHDSHRGIPRVDKTRAELAEREFLPFKSAIAAGVDMVMTSHILYPKIDHENPATFSRKILQGILRQDFAFSGVVVSDSMNMKAIRSYYAHAESAVLAILAGVDLIMLAEEHYDHDNATYLRKQLEMIQGVIAAVRSGRIEEQTVDASVQRILGLKSDRGLFEKIERTAEEIKVMGCPEHRRIEEEIAAQIVVRARDRSSLLPLSGKGITAVVSAVPGGAYEIVMATRGIGPNQREPAYAAFSTELASRLPRLKTFTHEQLLAGSPLPQALLQSDRIIVVTEDYTLPGTDFDTRSQLDLVRRLSERVGEKTIVVALRAPYDLDCYSRVSTYITTSSSRPCAAIAAARALVGEVPLQDRLPVSVAAQ